MNTQWSLQTHGNPLGKLRDFVSKIWREADLDGMLVTMDGDGKAMAKPRFIMDVALLAEINPFKPLMEMNAARLLPEILASHPKSKVGALLRPCELRALTEMTKHAAFNRDDLLTICVDCLGTLPADEYQWRLERMAKHPVIDEPVAAEAHDELAHEALRFARQGGVTPYRYRSACQVCSSPEAKEADINLLVLGLPVRQQMLVSTAAHPLVESIHLENLTDGLAENALIIQHERIISKMSERHQRTMERVKEGLAGRLPEDVDALIHQLESCGDCQKCLDVCPICSVDRPERLSDGHYDRTGVMRWLVSCAGCGMCEQACPGHLPTSVIFTHIRHLLAEQWEDVPARSINNPLPNQ